MIEQLKDDVRRLATPQGRMVGTRGHAEARAYLIRRIREIGLTPYADERFEYPYGGQAALVNVLARLEGTAPDAAPVLLAAHYDTCGAMPGADDNASAIAIAFAIADLLRMLPPERPVIFAFFDGEEPPHFLTPTMGSTCFYEYQRTGPIHCAVVLDLMGHAVPVPGLEDTLFVLGMESDPGLETVIRQTQPRAGLRIAAVPNRVIGDMSDHHIFRINRRPYLFFSCGQWEHYHMPTDTPEKLDYEKMERMAVYLAGVVEKVSSTRLDGPFEGYDSSGTELELMRKHADGIAKLLGLPLANTRDMERLVHTMIERFGLLTER